MNRQTEETLRAVMALDPTIPRPLAARALRLLRGDPEPPAAPPAPPVLVRPRDAASRLGVTERTLYSWSRSGRIRRLADTAGHTIGYEERSLDALVTASTPS